VIIFLHHFSQPVCIAISVFLLINEARMAKFTHQLLSRKHQRQKSDNASAKCEYSSRSATVSVAVLCVGYAESFSFNQAES